MKEVAATERFPAQVESIFAILSGTTIPDRAAIVRADCREGSRVELRIPKKADEKSSRIDVWLECRSLFGLMKRWKKIGHVPEDVAAELLRVGKRRKDVIAHGTVKSIYVPTRQDEAVVTVEIRPI